MENFFTLFGMPVRYFPDMTMLQNRFLNLSNRYQPNFDDDADPQEQLERLEQSEYVNYAYEQLQDYESRVLHILTLQGLLSDDFEDTLDPVHHAFLGKWVKRMVSIDSDKLTATVETWVDELDEEIAPILHNHDHGEAPADFKERVLEYFITRWYLLNQIE